MQDLAGERLHAWGRCWTAEAAGRDDDGVERLAVHGPACPDLAHGRVEPDPRGHAEPRRRRPGGTRAPASLRGAPGGRAGPGSRRTRSSRGSCSCASRARRRCAPRRRATARRGRRSPRRPSPRTPPRARASRRRGRSAPRRSPPRARRLATARNEATPSSARDEDGRTVARVAQTCYGASTLAASNRDRTSILVRMPSPLKGALVRETARRGSNINDVATGILAEELRYALRANRPSPQSASRVEAPVVLLRVPQELKDEIQAEASRSGAQRERRRGRTTLRGRARRSSRTSERKGHHGRDVTAPRTVTRARRRRCGSRSSAWATAPPPPCRASSITRNAKADKFVPGLMHVDLGGYHISDIEFTAAFDVVKGKVGEDLADAMWASPNDTIKFADVPKTGIKVSRGMTHDGIGKYLSQIVEKAPGADRRHRADPRGDGYRRRRQLPPRRLGGSGEVVRGADPRGRQSRWSTACRCSSHASRTGRSASRRPACRSSATTSSRRSARRSRTVSSRASSASAACTSTGRCS